MNEEIKNILEIIEKLETRINSYWNFYVIVVVAAIGWLMSTKTPFTKNQGVALSCSLVLFFVANFSVLRAATKRLIAFEGELASASKNHKFHSTALIEELSRPSIKGRLVSSYLLHVTIDIAVIYAIWSKLA